MNAPLIWVGLPAIVAVLLWFLRSKRMLIAFLASGFCLMLVLLARFLPFATLIRLGRWSFEISDTLIILGRKFVLGNDERSLLYLFFTIGAVWFFCTGFLKTNRNFVPLGLGIIGLFIGALSVQPFLYISLLVEVAVLLSIPFFIESGKPVGQGVLRYLIFQTLAVPFMLLAGWATQGVEASPADEQLLLQTVVILMLGFAFWLAVFPLYTWVPLLTGETYPFVSGFILSLLSIVVILLFLDFLNAFAWLRNYPYLPQMLRMGGVLMVVTCGIWSAFQNNLGRLLGYAVIIENGLSLLALSLGNRTGYEILVTSFLPRLVGLGLWAFALSVFIEKGVDLSFNGVRGLIYRLPVASCALLLAYFSIAGLPLLAGFPARQALLESVSTQSLGTGIWLLFGNLGFLVNGFRVLSVLVGTEKKVSWSLEEGIPQVVIMLAGMVILILAGVLPGWFMSGFPELLRAFQYL